MVTISGLTFIAKNIDKKEIKGKMVLDVGSRNSSTGIQPLITSFHPSKYVGVDIRKGKDVDIACSVDKLQSRFKDNSFDLIFSTEVVEHVKDWRKVISGMKHVLKPNGIIFITTRSKGFEYHMSPQDYWRYEVEDMRRIFSDFDIVSLERDYLDPGVFIKARKPRKFVEQDLSNCELYSMVADKRVKTLGTNATSISYIRGRARAHLKLAIYKAGVFLFSRKKSK